MEVNLSKHRIGRGGKSMTMFDMRKKEEAYEMRQKWKQ
jgi:hypothetical protein